MTTCWVTSEIRANSFWVLDESPFHSCPNYASMKFSAFHCELRLLHWNHLFRFWKHSSNFRSLKPTSPNDSSSNRCTSEADFFQIEEMNCKFSANDAFLAEISKNILCQYEVDDNKRLWGSLLSRMILY